MTSASLAAVVDRFEVHSQALEIAPFGSGHINDTYLVRHEDGSETVLQRLNQHVFPNPDLVMENMDRVCRHLAARVADPVRQTLRIIPTRLREPYLRDSEAKVWRLVHRVRDVASFDQVQSPAQANEVGLAFGAFQAGLADLPEPRLHETILDFHHTPKRLARLHEIVRADPMGRLADCRTELEAVGRFESQVDRLVRAQAAGLIPERITHNDTKLNNLLFDGAGRAQCVVDLDTVMPGLIHYDFGDMVRTATCLAREDEAELSKVELNPENFVALTRGYLAGVRQFVTPAEVELLAFSGLLITCEVGIRFLTDHLEGDVYFKIEEPGHNLRRARNQLRLLHSLQERLEWMESTVQQAWELMNR